MDNALIHGTVPLSKALCKACPAADCCVLCQILRFVKEWTHLTAMKQKIVRKSGQIFCSPIHAAEELSKKQSVGSSTKRYVGLGFNSSS